MRWEGKEASPWKVKMFLQGYTHTHTHTHTHTAPSGGLSRHS